MVKKKTIVSIVLSVLYLVAMLFVIVNIFTTSKSGMRTESDMNKLVLFIVATGVFLLALIFIIAIILKNYKKQYIDEKEEDDADIDEEALRAYMDKEKKAKKSQDNSFTDTE
ncbi:MAG: hypothetical protein IJS93_02645 [Clostridia bacterium]|nr:hypothetical protein [Clostridia bacterium]